MQKVIKARKYQVACLRSSTKNGEEETLKKAMTMSYNILLLPSGLQRGWHLSLLLFSPLVASNSL